MALLAPEDTRAETEAIRRAFAAKRDLVLARARALGMTVDREPDGTFYVWVSVAGLPEPIADGMGFFRRALAEKVITVPGEFFDVNPGKRRAGRPSRFRRHVRLSFGPSQPIVERALDRLAHMVSNPEHHALPRL